MSRIAVSNIAWALEEEPQVAAKLQELGVANIEIAPTKIWEDPTKASDQEINDYVNFWKDYGISIVAFQSMLFNRPDLKIFEDAETRQHAIRYLQDFTALAGRMGAKVLVFGSPKNRQTGGLDQAEVNKIGQEFFDHIGQAAAANDTCFCIEPNPESYACDYVTNTEQGVSVVDAVNNPGFGLHLDIAGMTLANDDIESSITKAARLLKHFHASSPQLGPVEPEAGIRHEEAARTLGTIGYQGFVSIEMRPGDLGQNVERVEKAVRYVQSVYEPFLAQPPS